MLDPGSAVGVGRVGIDQVVDDVADLGPVRHIATVVRAVHLEGLRCADRREVGRVLGLAILKETEAAINRDSHQDQQDDQADREQNHDLTAFPGAAPTNLYLRGERMHGAFHCLAEVAWLLMVIDGMSGMKGVIDCQRVT